MANFGPKQWTNPFGNLNFSTFQTSCFDSLERRFFLLEYRKTHFPGLYCLKEKNGKIANFGPKQWTNPLGKIAIFRLFNPSVYQTIDYLISQSIYPSIHPINIIHLSNP